MANNARKPMMEKLRPGRWSLALLLLIGTSLGSGLQANPGYRHQLDSREAWSVNAKPAVGLAVAAQPGKSEELERLTLRLGGRVDYVHPPTDYLSIVLPTSQVDRFLAEAPLEAFAVEKLAVTGSNPPNGWDPKPESDPAISPVHNARADWPRREGMAPVEHPYDVRSDMDGEAFLKRSPNNDGRGVVVAHVEYFPDFLSPELQTAIAADGKEISKFRDVINIPGLAPSLDPEASRSGAFWSHKLGAPATARAGVIEVEGQRHRVPSAGTYRMALLDLQKDIGALWAVWPVLDKAFHGRRYPQGLKPEDPEIYLRTRVLWSQASETLWIDTDQDGDFDDEAGVRAYAASQQIGVLGEDDPATILRETVGYTVQADGDYVSVNMGFGSHVTAVAGAVAASKGAKGRIQGVAPGVQLISINVNEAVSGYARGMIAAFEHPATDLVLIEGHAAITTLYEQSLDGRSLVAVVLSRLQALHDKPTFFTAFNTPGLSTVSDATVPDNVISVGAYQSAEAVYSNYGIHARYQDDLHWVGSEGPAGNGALKPDLLAPANPTSLEPGNVDREDGGKRAGVFRMIGYGICGGTSCATPVATGAAALLVGAAKREGLPVNGARIQRALRDSARPLARFPIYKQGRGLIQIDAAWQHLQKGAGQTPEAIEISAPVKSVMSPWLHTPNLGEGIFEREGWKAGQRATRTVIFKRTSGPQGPVRYRLKWRGDTGAFESPTSIELPLNSAVPLQVQITASKEQVYSALLELEREGLAGPAAVMQATVVVPRRFTAGNKYEIEDFFELDRPGRTNLFYDVPSDAGLVRFTLPESRKDISGNLHAPDNWQGAARFTMDDSGYDLSSPMAGSWQLMLMDMGDAFTQDWSIPPGTVLPRTKVKVKASLLRAEAQLQGEEVLVTNRGAAFTGGLRTQLLGAERLQTLELSPVQETEQNLTVVKGTERLLVELTPKGAIDSVWVNLYQCESDKCTRYGNVDLNGSAKRISVNNPKVGTWKVVITHYGSKPGQVLLRDTHLNPEYGILSSADSSLLREVGSTWRVPIKRWQRGPVPPGYHRVQVLDVNVEGLPKQSSSSIFLTSLPLAN